MKMRLLWLCALLAAAPAWAVEDAEADRVAAAKRYLEIAQMGKLLDDAQVEMAKMLQPEEREEFLAHMRKTVRVEVLEKAAMDSMVRVFTAEELNALADFYSTPVGKSAMGKFGLYMADVMPAVQEEIVRAMQMMPDPRNRR
ncbi:MAG TPA: DUF2059 domain-containing protein [Burkholderiales bacterium]|nr:DUF2059 domain-containing protein [Burkholderiales bacterium]